MTFPVPQTMRQDADMLPLAQAGSTAELLQEAIFRDLSEDNENTHPSLDDLLVAPLQLGDLGKAMLVKPKLGALLYCGATGNCPIWVYVLRNGLYESVLGSPSEVSAPQGDNVCHRLGFRDCSVQHEHPRPPRYE